MYKTIARGSSVLSLFAILTRLPCTGSLAAEITTGDGMLISFTRR